MRRFFRVIQKTTKIAGDAVFSFIIGILGLFLRKFSDDENPVERRRYSRFCKNGHPC